MGVEGDASRLSGRPSEKLHNEGGRTPGLRPEGKYPGQSPPRRSRQGRFSFFCPVRLGVAVAQLVECRIVIPVVAGSSPVGHPQAHFPQKAGLPGYVKRTVARNGGNVRTAPQTSSFASLKVHRGFGKVLPSIGASPSGKARGFDPRIRRFESFRPSHLQPGAARGSSVPNTPSRWFPFGPVAQRQSSGFIPRKRQISGRSSVRIRPGPPPSTLFLQPRRQAVRHLTLTQTFGGSNPSGAATFLSRDLARQCSRNAALPFGRQIGVCWAP